MSDIVRRFRKRAQECRRLAAEARHPRQRNEQIKMAAELDELADLTDLQIERAKADS